MEKTDAKGPAIGPPRAGLKVSEDELGVMATILRDGEDGDHDGNDAGKCPENGTSLDQVSRGASARSIPGRAYIKPREPSVAEGRDGIAQQGDGEKEEDLVVGPLEDADSGSLFKDVDASDEEEGRAKVDGQGDCDVADDVEPATDPAGDAAPAGRSQNKGLIVDTCGKEEVSITEVQEHRKFRAAERRASTSGSGIDARDFTKGYGNTDNDGRDQEPAPDDVDGPASDEGVVERSGEAIGDGGQDKGHEGHLQRRAVARQLRLVAEIFEELVSRVFFPRRQARRLLDSEFRSRAGPVRVAL